ARTTARLRFAFSTNFRPEAERFRQPQVEREVGGAGQIVDGNLSVGLGRNYIVVASGGCRKRARTGIGAECGAVVELQIAAQVLAHGDVVRRAGIENHEWTQPKAMRQSDRTPHKHPMPNRKGSSPVVYAQIVLIRWKVRGAGSVAVGVD